MKCFVSGGKSVRVRLSWPCRGRSIRTMSYETSKVPPDDAMPCGALPLVKCPLDVLGNVLPSNVLATMGWPPRDRSALDPRQCRSAIVIVSPEGRARADPYLLDRELRHCLLSCSCRQHPYHPACVPTPARVGLPMSMASCCMSSVCCPIFQPIPTVVPRHVMSLPCRRS